MAKLKPMDKQAKDEFEGACSQIRELIQDGKMPLKSAVVKVASQRGYGRWMAKQLARTCNTGMQWHPIREGTTLEEKTAMVDIAKANEVEEEMFGPTEKEAEMSAHKENEDYPAQVPDLVARRRADRTDHVAKAAAILAKIPDGSAERAFRDHLRELRKAGESREALDEEAISHGWRWNEHLDKAAYELTQAGIEFEDLCQRTVAAFGKEGAAYMDMVSDSIGEEMPDMSKSASVYMVDTASEPYATIGEGIELMKEGAALQDEIDELDGAIKDAARSASDIADEGEQRRDLEAWMAVKLGVAPEEKKQAGAGGFDGLVRGLDEGPAVKKKQTEKPAQSQLFDPARWGAISPEDLEKKELDFRAGMAKDVRKEMKETVGQGLAAGGGAIGSLSQGFVSNAGPTVQWLMSREPPEEPEASSMFPAEHMAYLRNRKGEALLTSMLSVDPVLSNQDPDEVKQAFNFVSGLRPDLMDHPALIRTAMTQLVRYSNEGDLETINKLVPDYRPDEGAQRAIAIA